MTEDLHATYETIDALQLRGDYEEIMQIAKYAIDAVANDMDTNRDHLSISGCGFVPNRKNELARYGEILLNAIRETKREAE